MTKLAPRPALSNLAVATPEEQVSVNWKYAAFAGAGLLVAQFLWWNAKAPEVFNPPSGSGGGY